MSKAPSRWSVITAFALLSAVSQFLWLNFAGVTTVAAHHYGVSESAVGWLAQVFPLAYVVTAIPAGLILDRWFRGGLVAGALLTALGAVLRVAGDDFGWLLLGQIVAAAAQPLVLNAIAGICVRYLAPQQRPTGIAVGSASVFGGMMVAFVVSAVLPEESQLGLMLTISTVVTLVAAAAMLAALFLVRAPHTSGAPSAGFSAIRTAIGDPFIRRICSFAAIPFGTFVALTTFSQALLAPAGVSAATASLILLANVVAGVLGCAVLPVLVARRQAQSGMLVVGLVVTVLACVILAVAPGTVTGIVTITLVGLTLLPALPVALELIERRCGQAESTAAGLMWMAGNLGGLIVATVVGLVVDQATVAFILLAVVTLLGLPFVRVLRPYLTTRPAEPAATTQPQPNP